MHRLLGIDAGKSVVRAALIRTTYRRVFVEALGEVAVTDGVSEAEAIRAAVGLHRPDGAAIALSGERSFYRRLDLPAAAQKEIENVLGFELEATVPFEMEDAVFDYRLLKRPPGVETLPVFAAVARADDVRERIAVVKEALGFEPERVALGAVALADLEAVMPELTAPTTGASVPIAILDLDYLTSEIVILAGGEPVFARTLSRGTAGLPGTAPALARELRQTLAAWRNLGGEPLAGLYLVGGGATAQGAELFLSTQLGLTILPLPTPRIEGLTPEQAAAMPRFAKALGLALGLTPRTKGFNLRKGALEAERSYPFLREKIPILAGLGTVIALSFGFSVVAEMRTLDAERELLLASLATASRDVLGEETSDPVKARELLDQGPGAADEDPMPRVDAFDVMVQLSKAVPKEITHDVLELDVNRGHVTIQGVVPSVSDAQLIAEHMKEHRCFRDVKISRTSQFTEGRHKYVLELDLRCEDKKKKPGAAEAADKPEGSR
ncbi:general secretion pathway protein GspL [Sorangium cellulosum]|uniref:General secretion pathway protein GspL n=1 Tax=Sorangium cellulosum TaxID=56 RepID=A0A150NZ27_SORCE|nr:general secretion pathway protein GspL [Sorangium cellulosum]